MVLLQNSPGCVSNDLEVGVQERVRADQLVVAGRGGTELRIAPVAELAAERAARMVDAAVAERRVLRRDAGVEHADDDALARAAAAAELRKDVRRAEELRRDVGEQLIQPVLLDGDHTVHREQRLDLVGRQGHRDAAVHRAVGAADVSRGDRPLDRGDDAPLLGRQVALVGAHRSPVFLQLLAGLGGARGRQARESAVIGRGAVVIELHHHVDRRAVGAAQQGRVALRDLARLGFDRLDRCAGLMNQRLRGPPDGRLLRRAGGTAGDDGAQRAGGNQRARKLNTTATESAPQPQVVTWHGVIPSPREQ